MENWELHFGITKQRSEEIFQLCLNHINHHHLDNDSGNKIIDIEFAIKNGRNETERIFISYQIAYMVGAIEEGII